MHQSGQEVGPLISQNGQHPVDRRRPAPPRRTATGRGRAAADLAVFHHYGPGELPDGVAFGASGLLYVAIATPGASGVSVLAPNGEEKARLANPLGSPVKPYDSPANIAFNAKGSILLSNHAFVTGVVDPSAFNVLDVFVGDTASPLAKPIVP